MNIELHCVNMSEIKEALLIKRHDQGQKRMGKGLTH